MFVQILVLFIVAIGLTAFYVKRPSAKVAHIPGFDGFTSFTRRNTLRDDTLKLTLQTKSKWIRHRILGIDFIYATHPESAKFLLSNPELFPKADLSLISEAMKDLFSKNLVQLNGDEWKYVLFKKQFNLFSSGDTDRNLNFYDQIQLSNAAILRQQRKAINPAFHFDTIKEFVPSFYSKTEQLMAIWKNLPNKDVAVTDWLHKFTLDVLGDTVFGHDFNSLSGEGENHFESYNRIIGYFSKPKNLILSLIEMKLGLKLQFQLYDAVKDLRSMCEGIISEKMEQKRLGTKPAKGHYDIVDMMLDAEPKMDLQALVANIFIFFLAGHETTASALSWQFYYLGNYPQVQKKAQEEVDRVIQGRPIKHEMLKELQYLSCVIKEGLRINPPAALIATRYVAQDTEFDGVTIPKGCRIGLAHETIHHLPEFWHEPEVFNPDRFLKENWLSTEGDEHHLKQHPFAYLPFSLKSRACIGNQFSLIEQMVFLASLLHHFDFKTKEIQWPTGSQALVKPDKVVVELNSRT